MKNKVVVFDGSRRLHIKNTLEALEEINKIKPLDVDARYDIQTQAFVNKIVEASYSLSRKQANTDIIRNVIQNRVKFNPEVVPASKIFILDQDLYSTDLNWCFGVTLPKQLGGLGTIIISTARLQSQTHAKDLIRHEIGHLFGAPNFRRTNTYQQWGTHCSNPGCVMKQSMTVDEAVSYAHIRECMNYQAYCNQCKTDILNYN